MSGPDISSISVSVFTIVTICVKITNIIEYHDVYNNYNDGDIFIIIVIISGG